MEQNNLVVTADGKTWDQVTRDMSYLGNMCVIASRDGGHEAGTFILDYWRGSSNKKDYFNKDFAIAYDRVICLKDGQYRVDTTNRASAANTYLKTRVSKNGSSYITSEIGATSSGYYNRIQINAVLHLKRGDYLTLTAVDGTAMGDSLDATTFFISRVE